MAKYGKPDTTGFRDDDLAPFAEWKKGIIANLFMAGAGKMVLSVEYSFTYYDQCAVLMSGPAKDLYGKNIKDCVNTLKRLNKIGLNY